MWKLLPEFAEFVVEAVELEFMVEFVLSIEGNGSRSWGLVREGGVKALWRGEAVYVAGPCWNWPWVGRADMENGGREAQVMDIGEGGTGVLSSSTSLVALVAASIKSSHLFPYALLGSALNAFRS